MNAEVYSCIKNIIINTVCDTTPPTYFATGFFKFNKFVHFEDFNFEKCGYDFFNLEVLNIVSCDSSQKCSIYKNHILPTHDAIGKMLLDKSNLMFWEPPIGKIIRVLKNLE
jgi:hypothetical protein